MRLLIPAAILLGSTVTAFALTPSQTTILKPYVSSAQPGFTPSAERGRAFFFANHGGGKADTPACTSCHTTDLKKPGQTRAGKAIDPMAPSVVPTRYSDAAEVDKWFRRNCKDVLGRECTAEEKADALVFLFGL
ncbi:DUF1924 domain-containing protein [Blastochloris tepida]|uniref:Cytochrome c-type protein SHP n=1 Tax=Blastochloris tepida TaxID=2233851 RepID=A0A348G2E6_9HYPH|nr:DUF1924 domain-containing protein [Blastochloris tepida]BBF93729.1 cytochrome c-type protein SHP [Blastochloris tepida]